MKFYWFIWIPRVLLIIFALFLTIFSWDVLEMQAPIWQKVLAIMIHNVPTIVLLLVLWLTWKRPLWGGIFFTVLTVTMAIFFGTYEQLETLLFISLPPFVASLLFFLAHYIRPKESTPVEPESQSEPTSEA